MAMPPRTPSPPPLPPEGASTRAAFIDEEGIWWPPGVADGSWRTDWEPCWVLTWAPTYRYVTEKPGMQARSCPPLYFVPASAAVDQDIPPPSPTSDVASDISASVYSVACTGADAIESEAAVTDDACHDATGPSSWRRPRRPYATKARLATAPAPSGLNGRFYTLSSESDDEDEQKNEFIIVGDGLAKRVPDSELRRPPSKKCRPSCWVTPSRSATLNDYVKKEKKRSTEGNIGSHSKGSANAINEEGAAAP
jgi:hypothetical protein